MNIINTGVLLSCAIVATTITLPISAYAEWSGGIEGGQVLQGNDKGTRLRVIFANDARPFSQLIYADWVRGESDSNSYEAGYEPQYWFSDTIYVFGEGSLRTAKSQQIDQQLKLLAGVGMQLLNTAATQLYGEVGAGQTTTTFDDTFVGAESRVDSTFTVARTGVVQTLSDVLKLELDADYTTSEELVQISAEAGVSFKVSGGAVKYSYRVRNNTVGDQDAVNVTDSSVSFNYKF